MNKQRKNQQLNFFDSINNEFTEQNEEKLLNEYKRDLHSMKMKEGLEKDVFLCPAYTRIIKELNEFDRTNLDYFAYEKGLVFGKFDD
jgi:hypothetical protein